MQSSVAEVGDDERGDFLRGATRVVFPGAGWVAAGVAGVDVDVDEGVVAGAEGDGAGIGFGSRGVEGERGTRLGLDRAS
jgi:hypothetical protein